MYKMISDEDFDLWQLCWKVACLFLHEKKWDQKSFQCIVCKQIDEFDATSASHLRTVPTYLNLAAGCSANHQVPMLSALPQVVCAACNVDLVYNITTGRQRCWEQGCSRILRAKKDMIERHIRDNVGNLAKVLQTGELERYLKAVDEHMNVVCLLCGDELPLAEGPQKPPTEKCTHDPNVCQECLIGNVEADIKGGRWGSIKCPDPDCREPLRGREVREYASPKAFQMYEEEVTRMKLSKNPDFRYCLNKDKVCHNGQIVGGNRNLAGFKLWKCSLCKHMNCFDCTKQKTCILHVRSNEEIETEETKRKLSKKCPGCSRSIIFGGACAHMHCRTDQEDGCGIKFCWSCKIIFPHTQRGTKKVWRFVHLDTCKFKNGLYEHREIVPRPLRDDPKYVKGWDVDPLYEGPEPDAHWAQQA